MAKVDSGVPVSCKIIIDDVTKQQWERYASEFSDYSIYQTWAYQQVRAETGRQQLCRVVITDGNSQILTICQIRIKNAKLLGMKIGYVQWGPLLRNKDGQIVCTVEALTELCKAFVGRRLNVLRIVPNVPSDDTGGKAADIIRNAGFKFVKFVRPYHTIVLSLNCSEDVLRSRLHQSWRRKLKKAEQAGIEVRETSDAQSFEILQSQYREMLKRKNFRHLDLEVFAQSQRLLSPSEKMNVIVAYQNGEPVTTHVTSNLGDTGLLLLVASNGKGFECGSSYLAWWRAVTNCESRGMKKYDVGGVDFRHNPTVSEFKAGLGGEDCRYIGAFEACDDWYTKLKWRIAEKAYNYIKGG